jgi:hypothetical protein
LQNYVCDPIVNYNQAGFDYFIANHVIKEKLDKYYKDSMVPSKLGDVWEPRIYVTIDKITWSAILDLGSSVSAIPNSLYDHLDFCHLFKSIILNFNLLIGLSIMLMIELTMFYDLRVYGLYYNGHGW